MSSTAYDDQYTYPTTIGAVGSNPNLVTINTGVGGFGGGGGSGMYLANNGAGAGIGWTTVSNTNPVSTAVLSIMAQGDGDAMIKTKKNTINLDEMATLMETLKERLLMLTPNFEKMEQYPALKEAYDHYKLIEALCVSNQEENK
jgi:uncharacterized spore protein YtfJ